MNRPPHRQLVADAGLRVSRYDQVAGLLLAVLIVLGFITLMMFLVWLSNRLFFVTPAVPVTILEDVGGGGSGQMLGGDQQFEEPSPEEVPQVTEAPIDRTLESIASVVATKTQDIDAIFGNTSLGSGQGPGSGDGRGPGPGGPGTSTGVPAHERWEVRMSAASIDEYARQLDFFKVELGVAGGGDPDVHYISNLAAAKPKVRIGKPAEERRLRFLHRSGELRAADRELAAKAGVKTDSRVVFQFYDESAYQKLLALEAEKKGSRPISQVRRTVFGVRSNRGRYEFYVIDQQYLGAT